MTPDDTTVGAARWYCRACDVLAEPDVTEPKYHKDVDGNGTPVFCGPLTPLYDEQAIAAVRAESEAWAWVEINRIREDEDRAEASRLAFVKRDLEADLLACARALRVRHERYEMHETEAEAHARGAQWREPIEWCAACAALARPNVAKVLSGEGQQ